MLVIGLTGPTGAGKGRVAELFSVHGLPVIDADAIYHDLLIPPSECLLELTGRFGSEVLLEDGTLNRRALGKLVFSDPDALEDLNKIAHRHVMREVRAKLETLRQNATPAAVLDAPQLFEAGANRDCNVIVSVIADKRLRMERIMRRDGLDADAAMQRIEAQKSDAFFRTHSDYVVENNDSADRLLPQIRTILSEMGVIAK